MRLHRLFVADLGSLLLLLWSLAVPRGRRSKIRVRNAGFRSMSARAGPDPYLAAPTVVAAIERVRGAVAEYS